jgi:hypothetical protein
MFIARRAARDITRCGWLALRGIFSRNLELRAMAYGEVTGLVPGLLAGLRNSPPSRSQRG